MGVRIRRQAHQSGHPAPILTEFPRRLESIVPVRTVLDPGLVHIRGVHGPAEGEHRRHGFAALDVHGKGIGAAREPCEREDREREARDHGHDRDPVRPSAHAPPLLRRSIAADDPQFAAMTAATRLPMMLEPTSEGWTWSHMKYSGWVS